MLLHTATPARLEFRRRGAWSASLLAAAVIGAFALTPVLAPGPVTGARAAFAALLAATALVLGARARPRDRYVRITLDAGVIDDGARSLPLAAARTWVLSSGGSTLEAAAFARYRAELLIEGGDRVVLIESPDPSVVIRELRRALAYLPLPVTPGWGLRAGSEPWRARRHRKSEPTDAAVSERGRPLEGELGTAICVIGGAVVVGTALALMHGARIGRGEPTALLSYALSASLFGFILGVGLFMLTDRVSATLGPRELVVERRALGIRWRRVVVPSERLYGVHAVGLVPNEARHLLIDAADGLEAIALVGEAAARFAARASGAGAAQSGGEAPATPPP